MKFQLRVNPHSGDLLDWLLSERGIEDIETYKEAPISSVQSPTALKNIDKAYEAFKKDDSNRVLTVVDSDMDGYCSSGILKNYLEKVYDGLTVDYFIHDQKQHGLSDVVQHIDLSEYKTVFLPDAGTNDAEYAEMYPETTFIILDHHELEEGNEPSENMIVVNNQLSPEYKNKDLSGTGVTWQFLRYIDSQTGNRFADDYWDVVAASIVSDMMDLRPQENRAILERGLKFPNNNMILALGDKESYRLKGELTPMGVAFYIAPLVNAMCRVGTLEEKERMFLAFAMDELFIESNARGAMNGQLIDVATESARECVNARSRQSRLRTKMADMSDTLIIEQALDEDPVLIIEMDERFHGIPRELNGLAAQEISKKHGKPVLIGRVGDDGSLKGSVRAPEKIPVDSFKEFLSQSSLFEYTEGHASAFGYSLPKKNLSRLYEYFEDQWKPIESGDYVHEVDYQFDKIDQTLKDLCKMKHESRFIWGRGVEEPVIGGSFRVFQSEVRVMGQKADTVRITKPGIEFMFFRQTPEQVEALTESNAFSIDIVGRVDINEYMGKETPQIIVGDYKIQEAGKFLF